MKLWTFALFALLLAGCTLQVANPDQRETISSSATVSLDVAPDLAEIYIAVETNASTAQEAQQKNAQIMEAVVAAIKAQGVDSVSTEGYNVYQQTDYYVMPEKNREPNKYYQATNRVKVQVKDFDKVGPVVDAAVAAGANRVDSISFQLTDDKKLESKRDAITKAGAEAKAKAQALADSVGANLGKLVSVNENSYDTYPRQYMTVAAFEKAADTPIEAGRVAVSATVNVQYEIK